MAVCDVAGAGDRTVVVAGRDGGDGGDAAAGRDGVAAAAVADDGGVVAVAGGDGGGEPEVAGKLCSEKRCPFWVRRCLRAPTYLLGNDVNKRNATFKHGRHKSNRQSHNYL